MVWPIARSRVGSALQPIQPNSCDNVVKRSRDFTQHLANTYRVLLSRGMKGVYTYFLDAATRRHFESLL